MAEPLLPQSGSDASSTNFEIYEDEAGTYWIPRGNLTSDQAKRIVERVAGSNSADLRAGIVRGEQTSRDGEPWVEISPSGPEEFWEVIDRGGRGSWPATTSPQIREWLVSERDQNPRGTVRCARLWLLDHAANWTERAGDTLASPWHRLSGWCAREYFRLRGSRR